MKVFRIVVTTLLIAWMVLIFCLSAQSAVESSDTSGRLITAVVRFFYSEFDEMSKSEQLALIEPFQFIVRKAAHFTIYAVLGAFAFASVMTYKKMYFPFRFLFSVMICFLYSVSDEIHQYYVPGRSCELRDVLIDVLGGFVAILLFSLIARSKKIRRFVYGDYIRKSVLQELYAKEQIKVSNLTCELDDIKSENDFLKSKIEGLKNEMISKEQEIEEIKVQEIEETKTENNEPQISPQKELGAKAIGRIIINAAKYCSKLSAMTENNNIKEMINLILGRTEVAKVEILNIVTSDCGMEEMKNKIKEEEMQAEDYFISVLGQI